MIKILLLKRDHREVASKQIGEFADRRHVERIISKSRVVIAPDRTIIAVYLKQRIDPDLIKPAYKLWSTVRDLPSNRATAVGTRSLPRVKMDGTLSERHGVSKLVLKDLRARHGWLGYVKRHKTQLTKRNPEWLSSNKRLIKRLNRLYEKYVPHIHAIQLTAIEKTPNCRIRKSVFSTVYLALNFRTAYHRDSGNLPGVMTALIPMGNFTGGELVFPRWRIAVALRPGDVLFFDPQQIHGNLPIVGNRLSAAFYCGELVPAV
jgi:Oxygenase domain of the 2OGFeDO superfamily